MNLCSAYFSARAMRLQGCAVIPFHENENKPRWRRGRGPQQGTHYTTRGTEEMPFHSVLPVEYPANACLGLVCPRPWRAGMELPSHLHRCSGQGPGVWEVAQRSQEAGDLRRRWADIHVFRSHADTEALDPSSRACSRANLQGDRTDL